jgi:peroxiredoxin
MRTTLHPTLIRAARLAAAVALALGASAAVPAIAPLAAAPDFTLHTMNGPNLRLQEQRGRVVMVLLDTDKTVSKLYELSTMPSTVIIDREGKVRYVHRGYLTGYEDNYEKQIRELLK